MASFHGDEKHQIYVYPTNHPYYKLNVGWDWSKEELESRSRCNNYTLVSKPDPRAVLETFHGDTDRDHSIFVYPAHHPYVHTGCVWDCAAGQLASLCPTAVHVATVMDKSSDIRLCFVVSHEPRQYNNSLWHLSTLS